MVCVGIVILLIIANSFLPFFGQRTPNEEKSSEIVEDNLGDQFTHDDDKQSMSATSVAVDYPDDYNYTDTQEEQQIAIENSQDLILNQAKQENWKTIKQIFNSNKINDKKGNTYE